MFTMIHPAAAASVLVLCLPTSASAQGQKIGVVVRRLGVSEPTYYRWRREYGGLRIDQAKRLKELERENSRLKRLVADQALDNAMLRDVAAGNF